MSWEAVIAYQRVTRFYNTADLPLRYSQCAGTTHRPKSHNLSPFFTTTSAQVLKGGGGRYAPR